MKKVNYAYILRVMAKGNYYYTVFKIIRHFTNMCWFNKICNFIYIQEFN